MIISAALVSKPKSVSYKTLLHRNCVDQLKDNGTQNRGFVVLDLMDGLGLNTTNAWLECQISLENRHSSCGKHPQQSQRETLILSFSRCADPVNMASLAHRIQAR